MQDTYDDQAAIAARSRFGKQLEEIYIRALLCGGFEKLPHLVDEKDDATFTTRIPVGKFKKRGHDIVVGPALATCLLEQATIVNRFTDNLRRLGSTPDNRHGQPAFRFRGQGIENALRRTLSDSGRGLGNTLFVTAEQSAQCNDKARFSAAVGSRPGKGTMARFGDMMTDGDQYVGRGLRTHKALKGTQVVMICVDTNRSLKSPCYMNRIRKHH